MAERAKKREATRVQTIRHKDKRKNIPTEELRGFVVDDEKTLKTMLYPRDPSLDPQLVWKNKDEQDLKDLTVPVVPIYIQEKIHPQALIDDLPKRNLPTTHQLNLFSDFNGLPEDFKERVDFYQHDGNWSNRFILGDSLMVMTSLADKEALKGKVQMIYIDPPYGINFASNWQVSTRKREVKDGKVEDTTRQPEQVRAFRDTWKLGIHSYLAYLRDRLAVSRSLVTETGSVFVQIGDENVHLVRCVMDEVFGRENFVSQIVFKRSSGFETKYLSNLYDVVLWYAKEKEHVKYRPLYLEKSTGLESYYDRVALKDGTVVNVADLEKIPEDARFLIHQPLVSSGESPNLSYDFEYKGQVYSCGKNRHWKTSKAGLEQLGKLERLYASDNTVKYVRYHDDYPVTELSNIWDDTVGLISKAYVVQTNPKVIERCILMSTDPGDLVLDPTCGSGTTAFVAEQWGRRWITIDTSRVALALARTRLMAAKYPYYLLSDSPMGIQKEAEISGHLPAPHKTENDIRKGFIYKRVPHVTLKSIANNPDIKEGMSHKEIDAAVAKHADSEVLYDLPFEDKKTVRVSGPFTVESLSPHRVLSTADDDMDGAITEKEAQQGHDFTTMILDNLRKAGVQNTIKDERLNFLALDPYAGTWVHAVGEYTEGGKRKRVAVSIGPEHGTVGPDHVKEAAKEAVKGVGFDLLLICGFAFDPHVSEESKRYGKLVVLPTRMNPDLAMGDELLKKTGAGNLFMVFGEPDVEIKTHKGGKLVVKINGVDVYDPTTGEIRSHSTDDIACWFIDTDYNGESFFVRHAYFTGAGEPYEKLKRALKAEIDESAWSSLYSTESRPFDKPETGKIAVKVINHYGDEVLKVIQV